MKQINRAVAVFLGFTLLTTTASSAFAGGITMYETGTPEVGLAAAGWAARAQDAATVYTNPAGMTRLAGDEIMAAGQVLYGYNGFSTAGRTTVSGGGGENPVGLFPGGSFYYSHSYSDRLKMGFALYGNFGLALDYGKTWAGRYHFEKGAVLGLTFAPTIAYKLTDKLSLGAALNIVYGYFSTTVGINNPFPTAADGQLKVDDSDIALGGNFGLLYEFSDATRVGIQYTPETKLDFSDADPEFSGLGPLMTAGLGKSGLLTSTLDLTMKIPQTAMASFYHRLSPAWAILGNLGWQDWSEYGKVGVKVESEDTTSLTVDQDYDDTYHFALGTQYDTGSDWLLSCGFAYDTGMVDDSTRTPDVPIGATCRFSVGGQYRLKENMLLGLGYTLLWEGDLDMNLEGGPLTGVVSGTYDNTNIQYFAVNLKWTF